MNEEDINSLEIKNNDEIIPSGLSPKLGDVDITSDVPFLANNSGETTITNDRNRAEPNTLPNPTTPGKSKRRSGGKGNRANRNQNRRFKPYNKLTWEEKNRVDERISRRAQRTRDEMAAVGIPIAPYNTSQFLINDYLSCHHIKTQDYSDMHNGGDDDANHHSDSTEDHYSSCLEHEDYYYNAFLEDYASMHEEYLNSLSQVELISEKISLEDKIELVSKHLREVREERTINSDPGAEMEKIGVFRVEIDKLFKENQELEMENQKLRELLNLNTVA